MKNIEWAGVNVIEAEDGEMLAGYAGGTNAGGICPPRLE